MASVDVPLKHNLVSLSSRCYAPVGVVNLAEKRAVVLQHVGFACTGVLQLDESAVSVPDTHTHM